MLVTRDETLDRLRAHMATILEMDEDEISEDSLFVDDLDADSLDLLEMILALKDEFKIQINDGEVKQLLTELARFLPEGEVSAGGELTDEELHEVARRLRVGTVVDFVREKLQ